jgi:hypothetical protein
MTNSSRPLPPTTRVSSLNCDVALLVDRGMGEDWVVIEVVVRKYTDHLPVYRQEAAFLRIMGITR